MSRHLLWGLLAVGLCVSTATAVFYGNRARVYREQLAAARDDMEQLLAAQRLAEAKAAVRDPVETADEPVAAVAQDTSGQDTDALQDRVKEMARQLQAKDAIIASLQPPPTNRLPAEGPRAWRGPQAWLDALKTNNPAQYEEFIKQQQEARQRVQSAFAAKSEHLLSQDLSGMNDEEQADYKQMITLLDDTARLADQLRTDLPPDQRHDVMHTLRQNMSTLEPLLAKERNREWYSLGRQMGYNEADAQKFVGYVNQVIDVTSVQNIYHGMRGGDGRGPRNAPQPAAPALAR